MSEETFQEAVDKFLAESEKPKKCQECHADEFAEFLTDGICDNCQDEKR